MKSESGSGSAARTPPTKGPIIDPVRLAEVKDKLDRAGTSVRDWAKTHGFEEHEAMVYTVLHGKRACKRGLSHRIAVALGLKDGDAVAQAELRGGAND